MKFLALSVLVAGMGLLAGGCQLFNTPGYSGQERFAQIGRDQTYNYEMLQDDIDHTLQLRPADRGTVWNVYHHE